MREPPSPMVLVRKPPVVGSNDGASHSRSSSPGSPGSAVKFSGGAGSDATTVAVVALLSTSTLPASSVKPT